MTCAPLLAVFRFGVYTCSRESLPSKAQRADAKVAELADARDLGSRGETRGGSTPPFRIWIGGADGLPPLGLAQSHDVPDVLLAVACVNGDLVIERDIAAFRMGGMALPSGIGQRAQKIAPAVVQTLEDALWEARVPMFGRRGRK